MVWYTKEDYIPKNQLYVLTAQQVERVQPIEVDQMLHDRGGLYIFVRSYGAKQWVFRYTSPLTNKRHKISLGALSEISLKAAR